MRGKETGAPCLLATPAVNRVAGLYNTHKLNLTGKYPYANDFEVRLKALTDPTKQERMCSPRKVMGGINIAWLAVWVPSTDVAAANKGVDCGPCPDFASSSLAFPLQLKEITENLSQASQKELG